MILLMFGVGLHFSLKDLMAVKAIAISRGFLSPIGIEIACVPSFADIVIDGEYRTAIRFTVDPRYTRGVAQPLGDDAHRPVPEIR